MVHNTAEKPTQLITVVWTRSLAALSMQFETRALCYLCNILIRRCVLPQPFRIHVLEIHMVLHLPRASCASDNAPLPDVSLQLCTCIVICRRTRLEQLLVTAVYLIITFGKKKKIMWNFMMLSDQISTPAFEKCNVWSWGRNGGHCGNVVS